MQPCAKNNLSDRAHFAIKEAIMRGKLDFGEPLSEVAVAEALNMSKAPVRSAFTDLKQLGLVDVIPKSGCYVVNPTNEEVNQLLDFRVVLELQAFSLALKNNRIGLIEDLSQLIEIMNAAFADHDWDKCHHYDNHYHCTFFKHANNKYLRKSYDNIYPFFTALIARFIRCKADTNESYGDHEKILICLKDGNDERAKQILQSHIERMKETYSQQTWPSGRASRKEYRFRDYQQIFAEIL